MSVPFPSTPNTFSNDMIRVRKGPQKPLLNMIGSKKKPEVLSQRYGTIKVHVCSNAPSKGVLNPAVVTFPYERNIDLRECKTTVKKSNSD